MPLYTPIASFKLIFFAPPVHDEDLLTQQRGEILPKQWQNVTQKVGTVVSHFLLRF